MLPQALWSNEIVGGIIWCQHPLYKPPYVFLHTNKGHSTHSSTSGGENRIFPEFSTHLTKDMFILWFESLLRFVAT